MPMLTATVAIVKIGHIEIEGLLLENKEFAIAVPQIADLFQRSRHTAARDFKRLMGKGFETSKVKTVFNQATTLCVSLAEFERLVAKLDRAGNTSAQKFRDDLIGLSLHQFFADAFNIKFEKEERQLWIEQRQAHRKQFHPYLTSWLKQDAGGDSSAVDWGKEVNLFKSAASLPRKPIEQYNSEELRLLNNAEVSYNALRKVGLSHQTAIASLN